MAIERITVLGAICQKHPSLNGIRYTKKGREYGNCTECEKVSQAIYYERNKDRLREEHRQYAKKNIAKNTERALAWARNNKSKHAKNAERWRILNPKKSRGFTANWVSKNLHLCAERESKKRAAAKQSTPIWANDFYIKEAYHIARLRNEMFDFKWQVDHIVPLINEIVCGLHCEQNLQVIPAKLNAAKGNRWWPDMPNLKG